MGFVGEVGEPILFPEYGWAAVARALGTKIEREQRVKERAHRE